MSDYGPGNDSDYGPGNDSEYGSGNDSEYGSGNDSGYGSGNDSEYGSGYDSGYGSGNDSEYGSGYDSGSGSGNDSEYGSGYGADAASLAPSGSPLVVDTLLQAVTNSPIDSGNGGFTNPPTDAPIVAPALVPTLAPVSAPTPFTPPSRTRAPVLPPPVRTAAPLNFFPGPPRSAPTLAPSGSGDTPAAQNFGWLVLSGVFVVGLCFSWRCWSHCRRKREKQMMRIRSAQADRVLGDMQMIPNEGADLL